MRQSKDDGRIGARNEYVGKARQAWQGRSNCRAVKVGFYARCPGCLGRCLVVC